MCPSLLPLLPSRPPSTSPPYPPRLSLPTHRPSPCWRPGFHPVLCSSSPPAHVSKSLGGQTPHPSPSPPRASIIKGKIGKISGEMKGNRVLGKRQTGVDVNGKHSRCKSRRHLNSFQSTGAAQRYCLDSFLLHRILLFCSKTMRASWKYSSRTNTPLGLRGAVCRCAIASDFARLCVGERAHFSRQLTLASLAEPPSARALQHPNNHQNLHF